MKTQSSYIRNWAAKAAFAIAILGFAGTVLRGQERYGEIDGTVTDASGAVIPGATVTLTHKATNRVYTFSTGADGTYLARNLEPGHYSVRFHVTGFADYDVPDVNLLLGKVLQLNASMAVARAEQTIEVSSTAAPLIDMTGTTVANNISSEEFNRLPKGRTFQDLVFISPSVNRGEIEGGFQVNGASGAENQFNVDGISTTSMINGLSRQNAVFGSSTKCRSRRRESKRNMAALWAASSMRPPKAAETHFTAIFTITSTATRSAPGRYDVCCSIRLQKKTRPLFKTTKTRTISTK